MPPVKAKPKKTAAPIPKAGAKSADPTAAVKKAIEAKLATTSATAVDDAEVDKVNYNRDDRKVCTSGGKSCSAYLMCADLKNNNNKFYVVQLLEDNDGENYYVWTRYGRVGDRGVTEEEDFWDDRAKAEKEYHKIVRYKTKKGYAEIKMKLGETKEEEKIDPKEYQASKLDPQL